MRSYLAAQSRLPLTYAAVGATAGSTPAGFDLDHTRIELGSGQTVYDVACDSLRRWKPLDLGWVEAWPHDTPIDAGETVAVVIKAMGLWWLNAARVVYVLNETCETVSRFGFAYGTLPGHPESGEERFLVEWDRAEDRVYYDIRAFSRPQHWLARVGHWQVRRLQQRFARDSAAAMLRAVNE